MRQRTAERLVDQEYAAAWALVTRLPPRPTARLFEAAGAAVARRNGPGVTRLRANLARLVPGASTVELDALAVAGMRSYARYWFEAFRFPVTDPAAVHAGTTVGGAGLDPLLGALASSRPVVMALPHSGNWDAAGIWLVETLRGFGREPAFTTVAERLEPESVYRRFVAYRQRLGFEVVAASSARSDTLRSAGAAAHRALTRRLRGGGAVCLVADRDVTGGGALVPFLGAPAPLPTGPARLAALTGALLVPVCPRFTPDGWAIGMAAPIPVPDRTAVVGATAELAAAMGELLAVAPADWHALQPIWAPSSGRVAVGG